MKKLFLLPAFLFLCSPFIVHAQDDGAVIENTFGIGPRLGYYHADDADDGTFYGGIQARIRLSSVLGIEGAVEYRPGTETSIAVPGGEQSFETKFVPVTGSLMLFLPLGGFSPYGVAGVGAYYTIYDTEGALEDWDNEFNFGYHLGFGLELPLSSNAALNVDYRYLFLTPEGENAPEDADFSGNAFTAGLMFYF